MNGDADVNVDVNIDVDADVCVRMCSDGDGYWDAAWGRDADVVWNGDTGMGTDTAHGQRHRCSSQRSACAPPHTLLRRAMQWR